MKRPILIVLIGYIIGIVWGLYIKLSIAPFAVCIVFLCINILKNKNLKQIYRYLKVFIKKETIIVLIVSSVISNTYVIYQNTRYYNLYKDLEKSIDVVCTVVEHRKNYKYKVVYKVKVEKINNSKKYKDTYLYMNFYKAKDLNIKYGDKIRVKGEYVKPDVQRNYKGFNYYEYLKTEKCYGIIKVKNSKVEKIKENNLNYIKLLANKSSNLLYEKANIILPEKTRDLLIAILIGKDDELEQDMINDFRDSSLAHMLAVSGSHISYIIISASFIIEKIDINKRRAKYFIIIILIFFMFLTGFSEPVVRACIMGIMVMAADIFYRKTDFITSISMSLLILLIENPFSIKNIGLLLSFGGTIGIVLYKEYIFINLSKCIKNKNKIKDLILHMLSVTCAAQIMITPIIILFFNTMSLTFFISNLLAGYLLEIITIFGFLVLFISMCFVNIAKFLGFYLNIILYLLIYIANICSEIPFSKIYMVTPNIITIIFYYIFFLLVIYFRYLTGKNELRNIEKKLLNKKIKIINWIKSHRKNILAILIVLILITNILKKASIDLKIYFVDVGQGDCTLIITPQNKSILIDGGGNREDDIFNVGEKILMPYLLNRKIKCLDYIIISHFDSDHIRTEF